jgi:hypothetical protein
MQVFCLLPIYLESESGWVSLKQGCHLIRFGMGTSVGTYVSFHIKGDTVKHH